MIVVIFLSNMTIFNASKCTESGDLGRAPRVRRLNGEVFADAVVTGRRGGQREHKLQDRDVLSRAVKYFFCEMPAHGWHFIALFSRQKTPRVETMTKAEQTRLIASRLPVPQEAGAGARNVARTCRHFRLSRRTSSGDASMAFRVGRTGAVIAGRTSEAALINLAKVSGRTR